MKHKGWNIFQMNRAFEANFFQGLGFDHNFLQRPCLDHVDHDVYICTSIYTTIWLLVCLIINIFRSRITYIHGAKSKERYSLKSCHQSNGLVVPEKCLSLDWQESLLWRFWRWFLMRCLYPAPQFTNRLARSAGESGAIWDRTEASMPRAFSGLNTTVLGCISWNRALARQRHVRGRVWSLGNQGHESLPWWFWRWFLMRCLYPAPQFTNRLARSAGESGAIWDRTEASMPRAFSGLNTTVLGCISWNRALARQRHVRGRVWSLGNQGHESLPWWFWRWFLMRCLYPAPQFTNRLARSAGESGAIWDRTEASMPRAFSGLNTTVLGCISWNRALARQRHVRGRVWSLGNQGHESLPWWFWRWFLMRCLYPAPQFTNRLARSAGESGAIWDRTEASMPRAFSGLNTTVLGCISWNRALARQRHVRGRVWSLGNQGHESLPWWFWRWFLMRCLYPAPQFTNRLARSAGESGAIWDRTEASMPRAFSGLNTTVLGGISWYRALARQRHVRGRVWSLGNQGHESLPWWFWRWFLMRCLYPAPQFTNRLARSAGESGAIWDRTEASMPRAFSGLNTTVLGCISWNRALARQRHVRGRVWSLGNQGHESLPLWFLRWFLMGCLYPAPQFTNRLARSAGQSGAIWCHARHCLFLLTARGLWKWIV